MSAIATQAGMIFAALLASFSGQTQSDLRPVETEFRFGCVGVDFKISHDYKFFNAGTQPIRIDTATANCDCSVVRFADTLVAPDDTASVRLIFNTADFYGPVSKSVRVVTGGSPAQEFKVWYHATVGQWMYQVQPDPVSLFFLPVHSKKTASIINHALDFVEVVDVVLLDDVVAVKTVKKKASQKEKIEFEVTPRSDLKPGEYLTNFTVRFKVPDGLEPLAITIPVKVVRY